MVASCCLGTTLWAQENIATFGIASQTSTCFGDPAEIAIDGNLGNFTHTCAGNDGLGEAVWELNLGGDPQISGIIVHNRTSCCGSRLRDIVISVHLDPYLEGGVIVGDPIQKIAPGEWEWADAAWQSELLNPENELGAFPTGPGTLTVTLDPPVAARYVRITRIPDPDNSGAGGQGNNDEADVLSLGEVEVFGEGGFECPAAGEPEFADTDCEGIFVDPPLGGAPGDSGLYTVTGVADDGTGDPILYTFFADSEDGQQLVSGPSTTDFATFNLLSGTWTFSVTVDDDGRCDDASASVTCVADPIEIAGSDNRALGKPTMQSSQLGGFAPSRAVDGNLGNFTHTLAGNNGLGPAVWEVDLIDGVEIATIDVFNRTSCCGSRLRDIIVSIHAVSFFDDPAAEPLWESELLNPENVMGAFPLGPPSLSVAPDVPVTGRYVRVTRLPDDDLSGSGGQGNNDEATVLSLGELEVFGVPSDCPAEGDTHCEMLSVEPAVDVIDGDPGVYGLTALAGDDSGDDIVYTFRAVEAGGESITIGPIAEPFADVTLTEGVWTLSVTVDDDRCPDQAADATCSTEKTIACQGEPDTHCEKLVVSAPPGGACGLYELTAIADDDSGDPILYTFTAENGVDLQLTQGPQTSNRAAFDLSPGEWTLSVKVDDDPACTDEADDVTCQREVSVGDCLVDIATGGIADQSSVQGLFNADRALDDNRNNFTHTVAGNDGLGPSIWEVDLLEDRNIARIVLFNRTSCCSSRLRDIIVSIHDVSFRVDDPPLGVTAEELPIWDSALWESGLLNPENEQGTFPQGPGQLIVDLLRDEGAPVSGRFVRITRLADEDLSGSDGQGNLDEGTVLSLGEVEVFDCDGGDCGGPPRAGFVRGDADANGSINLTDGIVILNFLFLGASSPACLDAADTDDDGGERPTLTDAVIIFGWLFSGGRAPSEPTPDAPSYAAESCGLDETEDMMDCAITAATCGG